MVAKALEGLSIESASDLQRVLRVYSHSSQADAFHQLESMLPVFQSRMGAMLFLISALLSRGLVCLIFLMKSVQLQQNFLRSNHLYISFCHIFFPQSKFALLTTLLHKLPDVSSHWTFFDYIHVLFLLHGDWFAPASIKIYKCPLNLQTLAATRSKSSLFLFA